MDAPTHPWSSVQEFLSCIDLMDVEVDSDRRNVVVTIDQYAWFGPKPSTSEWCESWLRRLEALELLAIIWHVDPHKWAWLVAEKANYCVRGDEIRDAGFPKYRIRWPGDDLSEPERSFFDVVFTPLRDDERSAGFLQVKASLQGHEAWPHVQEACEDLQISMSFECVGADSQRQHDAFMRSYDRVEEGPRRFTLGSVDYADWTLQSTANPIPRHYIDILHDQLKRRIPMSSVKLELPCINDTYTRHTINQLLTDLLGDYGPKRLHLHRMYHSRGATDAFFSKLTGVAEKNTTAMATQILHMNDFFYGESHAEHRVHLLWWVYGLFGPDTRHSIKHLDFTGIHSLNPQEEHIRWLLKLLREHGAPRPELFIADAFDEYAAREAPSRDQWLVVPSGTPIHVELEGDSPDHLLTVEDRVAKFRILRDDETRPFVDILVPGYGHCWVRRSETLALAVETTPVTPWTLDQHSIRTMEIKVFRMDEEEMSWMCALLELVGARMERLQLFRHWPRSDRDVIPGFLGIEQLTSFVRSCPRMHTLTLDNMAVDAASLVELYELHACKIQTLNLCGKYYRRWQSAVELLSKLADSSLQMTSTIMDLSLDVAHYDLAEGETDVMAALFNMLKANRALTSVHLHVPTSQLIKYKADFREVQETPVAVGRIRLHVEAKRAFLDVVHHKAPDLERGVLASIFQFAAGFKMRQVTITESIAIEQSWWNEGRRPR